MLMGVLVGAPQCLLGSLWDLPSAGGHLGGSLRYPGPQVSEPWRQALVISGHSVPPGFGSDSSVVQAVLSSGNYCR